jgi:hypothetical protein
MRGALRSNLNYANVMATIAVFVALGGGAYAAVSLPANSVGKKQIRSNAVDGTKLTRGSVDTDELEADSVTRSRLSPWARRRLTEDGRTGATGARGPQGPPGAPGPGARRIRFAESASASPASKAALDMPGLRLNASCSTEGGTSMPIEATTSEDAEGTVRFTVDSGSDPANPGEAQTGTGGASLTAGVPFPFGAPSAESSNYMRSFSTLMIVGASKTFTIEVVALVNDATGRCSLQGTAIAAS